MADDTRPTKCNECGKEFNKQHRAVLRLRAREIDFFDGPENAEEYVDEVLQKFHDAGHVDEALPGAPLPSYGPHQGEDSQ